MVSWFNYLINDITTSDWLVIGLVNNQLLFLDWSAGTFPGWRKELFQLHGNMSYLLHEYEEEKKELEKTVYWLSCTRLAPILEQSCYRTGQSQLFLLSSESFSTKVEEEDWALIVLVCGVLCTGSSDQQKSHHLPYSFEHKAEEIRPVRKRRRKEKENHLVAQSSSTYKGFRLTQSGFLF